MKRQFIAGIALAAAATAPLLASPPPSSSSTNSTAGSRGSTPTYHYQPAYHPQPQYHAPPPVARPVKRTPIDQRILTPSSQQPAQEQRRWGGAAQPKPTRSPMTSPSPSPSPKFTPSRVFFSPIPSPTVNCLTQVTGVQGVYATPTPFECARDLAPREAPPGPKPTPR